MKVLDRDGWVVYVDAELDGTELTIVDPFGTTTRRWFPVGGGEFDGSLELVTASASPMPSDWAALAASRIRSLRGGLFR